MYDIIILKNICLYPPVCDDGVLLLITTLFPSLDSRSTL